MKVINKHSSIIKRKTLILELPNSLHSPNISNTHNVAEELALSQENYTALVINSSHEMAKEITMQLSLSMPTGTILYAPTIELAAWTLRRRKIHLVVSSPILPDGGVSKLNEVLEKLPVQPDIVVVGKRELSNKNTLSACGYEFAAMRSLGDKQQQVSAKTLHTTLSDLGADIRNDLNNPLQEIVAMIFVAKASSAIASETNQALTAIDQAAQNMASYVNGLEDKIREAVEPHEN